MRVIKADETDRLKKTVVVLGNFDGLHKGHLSLIEKAKQVAKAEDLAVTLFTFDPHPTEILSNQAARLINSKTEKQYLAAKYGVDYYVEFPFTQKTAALAPEEFIQQILVQRLDAKVVIVGVDYRFGAKRSGNVELLQRKQKKYGYRLYAMEKIKMFGQVISSNRIRQEIEKGKIERANKLLGHPFFISGEVVNGTKLGREIGFPTANIVPQGRRQLPQKGVYLTKVIVADKEYYGLTNIGTKPTVQADLKQIIVETYIHNFSADIYGKTIQVLFIRYLRAEETFSDINQLILQMNRDKQTLLKYIGEIDGLL